MIVYETSKHFLGDIAHTITRNVFEILEVDLEKQPAEQRELYEKVF